MILYRILYSIFIKIYLLVLHFASLWNPKARLWVHGRKNILAHVSKALEGETAAIIWMHCSSLGEYEQGRPLLEKIRVMYPQYKILLTFFSPSGYNVMKGKGVAEYQFYLPFGNRRIASRFIRLAKPVLVLWVKYDYWYYFLNELRENNIPILLISANFYKEQPFFKWYGKMNRQMLGCFKRIFVQTSNSKKLLQKIGFSQVTTVSGDTRFDRVIEIAEGFNSIEPIELFCRNKQVIVAGSTWPEDEEELDHFANIHPEIAFIIAPHEIHEAHIKQIEKLFKRSIRFSSLETQISNGPIATNEDFTSLNVLIIDNIGMLSRLYRYATITYVGGGFGDDGVHNVLEAAVYGKPVVFGPVFNKYTEAIDLLEEGAAYTIETALELEKVFNDLLKDQVLYMEVCEAARKYVYSKKGATQKIVQYIQENRLLTN
jgi:3-deoxy-D-manno-octulosonic-acid transferase